MDFYRILLDIMDEQELSIPDVARACGLSDGTIRSIIVRKSKNVSLEVAFKLSNGLHIPLERLNGETGSKKKDCSYSPYAMQLAKDYDTRLDRWGRELVRAVADKEIARCNDERRFLSEIEEPEPKVITLYLEPSAAGIATPVQGRDFTMMELGPDDPQGAAYAVRLQGDSMEPDFPDGSIVFVNHDSLADGDIGIFSIDGGTVCKQYHKDQLGMVYLFSLNRARAEADVLIAPSSNQTLVCQGRVITRRHYPIPGR